MRLSSSVRLFLAALALVLIFVAPAAMLTANAQELDCRLLQVEFENDGVLIPAASSQPVEAPPLFGGFFTTFSVQLPNNWINPRLIFTAPNNTDLADLIVATNLTGTAFPQVLLLSENLEQTYGFQGDTWTPTFPLANTGLPTLCGQTKTYAILSNESLPSPGRINECNYTYYFTVSTSSCVVGDPVFAGLRGQHFQVHGIDGMVYALISAPQYAVNSRFDFLSGPRPCPIMPTTGAKAAACWTHPGSYVGAIGVKTLSGDSLVVESGSAKDGFAKVLFNGREVQPGDMLSSETSSSASDAHIVMMFNSTHEMTIEVGDFSIVLENVDSFVNLRSVFVSRTGYAHLAAQHVHGLLGQTWRQRRYSGTVSAIEGEVDQYVIESNDLLDTRFVFSQFTEAAGTPAAAQ